MKQGSFITQQLRFACYATSFFIHRYGPIVQEWVSEDEGSLMAPNLSKLRIVLGCTVSS